MRFPHANAESARLRFYLLLILVMESLGIAVELVLSGHTADLWQWVPLALIGASLIVILWMLWSRGGAPVRALQVVMVLFILSGFIGLFQHYRAKAEFQLEVNPSLQGTALFWEAAKSLSPPTLAPGVMIQMGLLGLVWSYRHPSLGSAREDANSNPER